MSIYYCSGCYEKHDDSMWILKGSPTKYYCHLYRTESMGSDRLASVWDHPSGAKIPVNEKGNVIHTLPKYQKKKGEKPLW